MRIKPFYFLLLVLLLFSCKSTPLGYDKTMFLKKDGKLFEAVKYGSITDVKTALNRSPNINVSDYLEQTAFMWACRNGNLDIINVLLDYNERNRGKRMPLHIKAKSSEKKPELSYNALFCYIMSKGIIPSSQAAQDTLTRIINLDKKILDMTDWYGETVIHKLVRSNNDYFDVIIRDMDGAKKKDLFNRKSEKYGQSPLMLAIELGNRWIIDALVNDGTVIDDITDDNMPVYAFNQGNGDVGIFTSLFKGKMKYDIANNSGKREKNQQFETAFDECSKGASSRMFRIKIFFFYEIYRNYLNTDITDPKDLEPREYASRLDEVFEMLKGKMTEQEKQIFFEQLKNFPEALKENKEVGDMNRTLLQMVIENQDTDVFKSVLEQISPYKIPRPSNGTGDYLTIAMLKRRTDIMHILLDKYPDFDYSIETLMNPNTTRIAGTLADATFGRDLGGDPLMLFCTDEDLSSDRELLRKMARFYRPKYNDNIGYCTKLLSELAENKQFDIYESFLANYGEFFYQVERLNDKPIIEVLLDNGKQELVQMYIMKNRNLDRDNEKVLKNDQELWNFYDSLKTPPRPVPVTGKGNYDKQ